MNKFLKKLISGVLAVVTVLSCAPFTAFAATVPTETDKVAELSDGYLSVSVSKQTGGFLVDTLKGNQLKSSDDNAELLFNTEGYDTSFTSFRITRTDGKIEDYVFGRQYGFLGLDSSDVAVEVLGSDIIATWSVKDLTIVQTLTLMDEMNPQHGMVDITYDVTSTSDTVANVQARIMLDTALGDNDWAMYQLYKENGSYTNVLKESVIQNPYDNILKCVTADFGSPITAYTVNAVVEGTEQKPYQVAIGHWANMATTVFDFMPDITRPDLNNPYDGEYLTADSAYALYYDLGKAGKDETVSVSTFYGVYSNSTVSENESVGINFTQLPSPMTIKDGSSLESASYHSQVAGGSDGDIQIKMLVENYSASALSEMTVVVNTMKGVSTYTGNYPTEQTKIEGTHSQTLRNVASGEELALDFFFNVTPLEVSEYRYFEVEVYSGTKIVESKLLGSRGFYLLCPSVLGEQVSFNTGKPQIIYTEGRRRLFFTGENFQLLEDTSAYTAYLKQTDEQGNVLSTTVVPGKNIIVNKSENIMNVVVESTLDVGNYQLALNWNTRSSAPEPVQTPDFDVSDDPSYKNPIFGIVAVEKTLEYSDDDPTYQLSAYDSEKAFENYWAEKSKTKKVWNANEMALLVFKGDFSIEYDDSGNIVKATATSVKNADGSVQGTISISDALDVEGGHVTISVENPGAEDQNILTDIEGHVFTSGERTTVWDGVCALTAIANGEINQLKEYYMDGKVDDNIENTTNIATTINLVWPDASSKAQEFCGMFFELRYCEFGLIAKQYHDPAMPIPTDAEKERVVSFSAMLDPSFLLPTNYDWKGRETSAIDAAQLTFTRGHYTPDQLRDYDAKFKRDKNAWMEAQEGTLVFIVDNILYGDNRFIGFSASLEVGLPPYFDAIGGIEGILSLDVWLQDRSNPYYEIGVEGAIELPLFQVEAKLVIKSINGWPVPDELYLYVGGFTPGLNIDSVGVVWLTGLGGGFSGLYDSIMSKSKVPPFMVYLEGGFSLFQILYARIKLGLGPRGFNAAIHDLGLNKDTSGKGAGFGSGIHGEADILTIIPYLGIDLSWYPKFRLHAGVEVNVLSIIEGGGYLVLEENTDNGKIFFEALATCKVKTPKIPLIGSITLGGIDIGIDTKRVFGVLHILKLDMGVVYYYGGDIDFSFGKYDVPGATLCSMQVGELENGEPVYMVFGTNITEVASSRDNTITLGNITSLSAATPSIISATDRMHHTFTLGSYATGDGALTVTYNTSSLNEARAIAMGGTFNDGLSITDANGNAYELTWLDATGEIDPETADSANAILNYDEETGEATVTISFTEAEDFQQIWNLTSSSACELVLYSLSRLADVDSVSFAPETKTVSWTGSQLEDFDSLVISAIGEDETRHILFETTDSTIITSGKAVLTIPEDLPSGTYGIQVVAQDEEGNVNDIENVAESWNWVNPLQPANPTVDQAKLGGDYTIDVNFTSNGTVPYDGYVVTIYEQDENGQWVASDYAQTYADADATSATVGGRAENKVWLDAEGNEISYIDTIENPDIVASTTTRMVGLEAGKEYRVGVMAYVITDKGNLVTSQEQFTAPITMVEPDPAEITVSGLGAKQLTEKDDMQQTMTRDVFITDVVTVELTADQAADVVCTLDNSTKEITGTIPADGSLKLTLGEPGKGLDNGGHLLKIRSTNANGDEAVMLYNFRVDTAAPKLMLTGPENGSFFEKTVTVTGSTEEGALVIVTMDGQEAASTTVGADGTFALAVAMDQSTYEHTLAVTAQDAAGNVSAEYRFVLVNRLIANRDAELAIYLDGEDVTGQGIPGGTKGYLELCYILEDDAGQITNKVSVPYNSSQGNFAQWDTYIVAGSGSVKRENGIYLETSENVNGMLTVTIDKQQLSAVLGGNDMSRTETFTVTLPSDPEGYTIETNDPLKILKGGNFRFTVTSAEGYSLENMKVFANGVQLTAKDGKYIVGNISSDVVITVTGVSDTVAPEITITEGKTTWQSFISTITFGLFYKDTQQITITATDAGSGINSVYYYIANDGLTEDQVTGLTPNDWTSYNEPFNIEPNGKYVVYAKAVDKATNITYVSSDGMVLKNTTPVITGVENGGTYYGDQTVTVTDPYLSQVTLDGETVTLVEGKFTVTADNGEHTITAVDCAGNETVVKITVYKIYTVTFVANNETVATIPVNHGSDLPAEKFPEIPPRTGYDQNAPVWNPTELTNVTTDTTVVAVYTQNSYKVILPENPVGYTVTADKTTVLYGEGFTFTVKPNEGYDEVALKVTVNGKVVTPENGIYSIPVVTKDQTIAVEGIQDITAPTAQITVADSGWREFLNTITFGLFFKETQTVTITAADSGSGIGSIGYVVANEAKTLEALKSGEWTDYDDSFTILPDGYYVIYAKVTDKAGNETYVSSDGLILDETAPVISGIRDGHAYYGEISFTVADNHPATVTVNGETVYDSETDGTLGGKTFTLQPTNGLQTVVATDKAGNSTTVNVYVYAIYTVTFVAGGEVVATIEVNHGAALTADRFPVVPAKDCYAGTWDSGDLTNVTADVTVNAVYVRVTDDIIATADTDVLAKTITVTSEGGSGEYEYIIIPCLKDEMRTLEELSKLPDWVSGDAVNVFTNRAEGWYQIGIRDKKDPTNICAIEVQMLEAVTFTTQSDYPKQTILVDAQGGSGEYEFLRVVYNADQGMKTLDELKALTGWVAGDTAAYTFTECTADWYQIAVRDKNDPDNLATSVAAGSKKLLDITMIAAEPSMAGITVTWEGSEEAKFYQVYRLASGETNWTLLMNTDDLSYVDTSAEVGVKYYYKVIARNGKQMSTFNIQSVGAIRPLANVVMTGAVGHRTGIIVSWAAVENADLYQVYRRADSETSWTLLRNTRSTAVKDETAEVGVKYYYKVVARTGRYISSLNIPGVSAVRPANPAGLDPVKMEKAVGYTSGIIVYWNAVEHAEVYHVYRCAKGESEWKLIATTGSLAYKDTAAESGVTYSYKTVARYGSLTSSEDISPVSAIRP